MNTDFHGFKIVCVNLRLNSFTRWRPVEIQIYFFGSHSTSSGRLRLALPALLQRPSNRTLSYDENGSLTNDGLTRTFEWDAANRLTAINYTSGNRSEFTYDGLSRCVKIVEKTNGSVISTRKFVWCGNEKCEFRDANDAVTLMAYPQGQYVGVTKYFYFRDHLGSIREMMRSNGTLGSH